MLTMVLEHENSYSAMKKNQKRNIKSFEPDPDVDDMLEKATKAGAVFKELMNEALRLYSADVLKKMAAKLRRQADEIEKSTHAGKR